MHCAKIYEKNKGKGREEWRIYIYIYIYIHIGNVIRALEKIGTNL